jgi:hypothetical protein
MIIIMFKNVDLNDKWWIELIKTINYLRNRFSMIDKSIIFYEIDTKRKFFFVHFRRIETIDYVMKRKSITKWKKLISKSFSIVLVKYEEDHIYRMLRFNEIIYRVSSHLNQEKTRRIIFRRNLKTINLWINRIFDEKTSSRVKFDNHSYLFVSAQSIKSRRLILFDSLNRKN